MPVDGQGVPFVQPDCLRAPDSADSAAAIEPSNKHHDYDPVVSAYRDSTEIFAADLSIRQIYFGFHTL